MDPVTIDKQGLERAGWVYGLEAQLAKEFEKTHVHRRRLHFSVVEFNSRLQSR
jgi:hypothetical protein